MQMRTNIVIDSKLIEQAMLASGLTTKKDVVDRALREFVQRHTQKDLAELRGKIQFADDYDYKALREGR
jgi:Arc/MetJ family transcription regulator